MDKYETKYQNSAKLMDEALIDLLNDKDFEYITVKEICKKAGVNRSTFYLHYETIDELLSETCQWYLNKFQEYYKDMDDRLSYEDINSRPLQDLILTSDNYLIPYLNFMKENKKIMVACLTRPNTLNAEKVYGWIFRYVSPIMSRFGIEECDKKYIFNFAIHGLMAILVEWMKNDFKEPVEHIVQLIKSVIPSIDGIKAK